MRNGYLRMLLRLSRLRKFVSLTPFDLNSEEGRSNERYRRVILTALTQGLVKIINVFVLFVSVPLTVNYLGKERYGLWITISSVTLLLGFADFGIGNGLLNAISEAYGKGDRKLAREFTSSAFFLLLALSTIFAAIIFCLFPHIPWHRVFNITTESAISEAGPAIAIFLMCFLINIPLGVIQRVQVGYQEGYSNGIWSAVGNILSVVFLIIVIKLQGSLPWLVLALVGSPILALIINGLFLFYHKHPWLKPSIFLVKVSSIKRILKQGIIFFILQIAVSIGFQSDNLIIAQMLGAEQVTDYAVPMRLFSLLTVILGMFLSPLWPAYGEAIARKDRSWVERTFRKSLLYSFVISTPLALILIIFGREIIALWVGPQISPSMILLIGCGLWTIMYSLMNPIAMLLNGANIIKLQAITSFGMVALKIGLAIPLVKMFGNAGVIYATVISLITCSFLPLVLYVPRVLEKVGRND